LWQRPEANLPRAYRLAYLHVRDDELSELEVSTEGLDVPFSLPTPEAFPL